VPATLLALQVLLILLPGFAAAYIVQLLAVRGAQTDFDKVIEASLYSVLIYGIFSICYQGSLPFEVVSAKPPLTDATVHWFSLRLIALFFIILAVALFAILYINKDGNQLFRNLKLKDRTTRRSVWNDIFQAEAKTDQVVQVELDGNRSLIGVLVYWSDSAEENSLFVAQAKWVSDTGQEVAITGPGVLLTRESKIKSIALLDDPPNPANPI
jgi:hypothetical protein